MSLGLFLLAIAYCLSFDLFLPLTPSYRELSLGMEVGQSDHIASDEKKLATLLMETDSLLVQCRACRLLSC